MFGEGDGVKWFRRIGKFIIIVILVRASTLMPAGDAPGHSIFSKETKLLKKGSSRSMSKRLLKAMGITGTGRFSWKKRQNLTETFNGLDVRHATKSLKLEEKKRLKLKASHKNYMKAWRVENPDDNTREEVDLKRKVKRGLVHPNIVKRKGDKASSLFRPLSMYRSTESKRPRVSLRGKSWEQKMKILENVQFPGFEKIGEYRDI
eukprot:jgi/Bigna1/126570/aug1.2_g1278